MIQNYSLYVFVGYGISLSILLILIISIFREYSYNKLHCRRIKQKETL